jgi:hypothetical protein
MSAAVAPVYMTTTTAATSGRLVGLVAVAAMLLGGLIFGYGLLVLPVSVLGGVHIAAIGLSLILSGLFATEWAGARFGLDAAQRTRLSLGFAVLAVLLLVAFVVINFASFESFESSGSSGSESSG